MVGIYIQRRVRRRFLWQIKEESHGIKGGVGRKRRRHGLLVG
jgi:hypothetical protein